MSLAFETILILDGIVHNIAYHEARMNKTRAELFGSKDFLSISLKCKLFGSIRCRVVYERDIVEITYEPYVKKQITKLKLIESDTNYKYKLANRSELDGLYSLKGDADDVLIVKDGLLSDTTIANIALFDGEKWVTPAKPLLKGTVRERLLDKRFLVEQDIRADQLGGYQKIAIMNALRGFEEISHPFKSLINL